MSHMADSTDMFSFTVHIEKNTSTLYIILYRLYALGNTKNEKKNDEMRKEQKHCKIH